MNRQEHLINQLQERVQELIDINEEHRKLNGTLRKDLGNVWEVLETISPTCCDNCKELYNKIPLEVLEAPHK